MPRPVARGSFSRDKLPCVPTMDGHLHEGYCDTTGFNNVGACQHDDKGSFGEILAGMRSWTAAFARCRERCLGCERCNYVSLSIQWNDCSWFESCDLTALHTEVVGHRTARVRNGSGTARPGWVPGDANGVVRDEHTHEQLWSYLRSLPQIDANSCWRTACGRSAQHALSATQMVVGMTAVAQAHAASAEGNQVYGHIWRSVEAFFQCVVLGGLDNAAGTRSVLASVAPPLPPRRKLYVPAQHAHEGKRVAIFREITELFSGRASRLRVVRSVAVPVCLPPWERHQSSHNGQGHCCHNESQREAIHRTHARPGLPLPQVELHPEPPSRNAAHLRAMRRVAWANLDVADAAVDTVVLVSTQAASNGRRLANEEALAAALRALLSEVQPQWHFRHQRLESLSYVNEVRLMRRTAVLISLFGSGLCVLAARQQGHLPQHPHTMRAWMHAVPGGVSFVARMASWLHATTPHFHPCLVRSPVKVPVSSRLSCWSGVSHRILRSYNCQFMPEGGLVLQVHGALKGEVTPDAAFAYRRTCHTRMGLDWAAYAVPGWNCSYYNLPAVPHDCPRADWPPSADTWYDFHTARVSISPFLRFVHRALDRNLSSLLLDYARVVLPGYSSAHDLTEIPSLNRFGY